MSGSVKVINTPQKVTYNQLGSYSPTIKLLTFYLARSVTHITKVYSITLTDFICNFMDNCNCKINTEKVNMKYQDGSDTRHITEEWHF